MYVCMYVRTYVCLYVCTFVCMYVCTYVPVIRCDLLFSTSKVLSPEGCQNKLIFGSANLRIHLAPTLPGPSLEPSHGSLRPYHWTMTRTSLFLKLMKMALWNCSSASVLLSSWFPAIYHTYLSLNLLRPAWAVLWTIAALDSLHRVKVSCRAESRHVLKSDLAKGSLV